MLRAKNVPTVNEILLERARSTCWMALAHIVNSASKHGTIWMPQSYGALIALRSCAELFRREPLTLLLRRSPASLYQTKNEELRMPLGVCNHGLGGRSSGQLKSSFGGYQSQITGETPIIPMISWRDLVPRSLNNPPSSWQHVLPCHFLENPCFDAPLSTVDVAFVMIHILLSWNSFRSACLQYCRLPLMHADRRHLCSTVIASGSLRIVRGQRPHVFWFAHTLVSSW